MSKIDKTELKRAVASSLSYVEVCKTLGVLHIGGTYRKVRNLILKFELDTSHFKPFIRPNTGGWNKIPLEEILVENSTYGNTSRLKKRLIKQGILTYICNECGQSPEWNNKPLTLELDHINGISNDHRIENLRILCPHCHSQTNTYRSKNK